MLVIIGLIVGGALVGQNLIAAAGVRATISQIEKYNTAANTFRGKYGYLPGDIKDPDASSFGFQARGTLAGQGDGNGILQGNNAGTLSSLEETVGENVMFWVDLSTAGVIDGNFNTAHSSTYSGGALSQYFPNAKIRTGDYITVLNNPYTGQNAFCLESLSGMDSYWVNWGGWNNFGLTVQEAFMIDKKIDDGLPTTGNVTAQFNHQGSLFWTEPATGWGGGVGSLGQTAAGSSSTCFDDAGSFSNPWQYSVAQNNSNLNCALTIRMQAGD